MFVFQHSGDPQETLLAHVLAVTSASKGYSSAKWLAAASMDRYLWLIKQPQIFGTQFKKDEGKQWTMEPYDRIIISDSLRALWCVVPQSQQDKIAEEVAKTGQTTFSTSLPNCE